jgi:Family of unknown function (DUF5706)
MDPLTAKLFVIFQNVNDWLKFAEAKNAALFAFSATGLAAPVTLLATVQNLPNSLKVGLIATASLLCVCALLCAWSFLPKTNLEKLIWIKAKPFQSLTPNPSDNLYYFGHLQKYSSDGLLDAISQNYLGSKGSQPYPKEAQDLASQITINSAIAFRKYKLFMYSTYCLVASIIALPVIILSSLILFRGLA